MNRVTDWPATLSAVASLLVRAVRLADEHQSSAWDFAVEIEDLLACNASRTDLRWLECRGLVEHKIERFHGCCSRRQFRHTAKFSFEEGSCFVLTNLGLQAAISQLHRSSAVPEDREFLKSEFQAQKPLWNAELFMLSLGDLLVKEYRNPAKNQQLILCVFQEEDWPDRIDDPLPPVAQIDPKKRLQETIAALNRHQQNQVLRFSGDGTGRGVKWRLNCRNARK